MLLAQAVMHGRKLTLLVFSQDYHLSKNIKNIKNISLFWCFVLELLDYLEAL